MIRATLCILLALDLFSSQQNYVSSFSAPSSRQIHLRQQSLPLSVQSEAAFYRDSRLFVNNDKEKELAAEEEEVRVKILGDRRKQIRSSLKAAESLRNFRIDKGYVPELGEDGKPIKSDGKVAVTLTAFMVAGGAVALRIGGRAALISGLGLNFVTDNPELKENLDQILLYSDNMDPLTKAAAFVAAWTAVKVFCVDFAGVALVRISICQSWMFM